MDGCIGYTGIMLLLFFIPSFFFLSNFQTLKFFVTLFSGSVWPRRLKLNAYMTQAAVAYSSLYFVIFLSNFQTLKLFVTLFSGTVRPRRLKLGIHMDSCVYWNQAAATYSSFISSFFFLSNFQTLKCFITLFSGTVRPRRLKLGTHMDII